MKTKRPKTTNGSIGLSADEQARIAEHIRIRAHELWLAGGGRDGNDLHDWLQAEQEVRIEHAQPRPSRSAIRV